MKVLKKFDIYDGVQRIDASRKYKRVSRWIAIQHNYNASKRNALYDYNTDENGSKPYHDGYDPSNGTYLDFFRWNGRTWALDQFMRFGSVCDYIGHFTGYIENGEYYYLAGYDSENYFDPILIELDEYCEKVRVYTEA